MKVVGTAKEINTVLDALPRFAWSVTYRPLWKPWGALGIHGFFRGVEIEAEIVDPEMSDDEKIKTLVGLLRSYGVDTGVAGQENVGVPKALLRLAADVIECGNSSDDSGDVVDGNAELYSGGATI